MVVSKCANYDKEYGCLPLDCNCYMYGICYTNSALCRYFRKSVLPEDKELQAVFESMPLAVCKECGKHFQKWHCTRDFPVTMTRLAIATALSIRKNTSKAMPSREVTRISGTIPMPLI